MPPPPKPLEIGAKYGMLTIEREAASSGDKRFAWCLCDCGNKKPIELSLLKRGDVISCGCKKKANTGKYLDRKRAHTLWYPTDHYKKRI